MLGEIKNSQLSIHYKSKEIDPDELIGISGLNFCG